MLAALALSIGWGIRGNYGHETGAMFPGAIVVCLLSGREDWRGRVAYFACFGALGWGFGGFLAALTFAVIVAACAIPAETEAVRRVYGDTFAGHGGKHLRFGDEASWKIYPILKHERHR